MLSNIQMLSNMIRDPLKRLLILFRESLFHSYPVGFIHIVFLSALSVNDPLSFLSHFLPRLFLLSETSDAIPEGV